MLVVPLWASAQSVEEQINKLISQMTLEEKIGQLNQVSYDRLDDNILGQAAKGSTGCILNELDAAHINAIQKAAVEKSRLHIPIIFARDVIHGFKTIFPIPLGQAASWNPNIAREGARIAALESSSVGIRWTFAPMMDVTREPRWGRIAESCGEDPLLTAAMTTAMIEGFQGNKLSDATSIAACAKHFAAYGFTESGKDYNTTHLTERELRDVVLPPFKAAAHAGCATFMCSFNDIDGLPSSGNRHLLTDILRGEWGYDGMVDSDWSSVAEMVTWGFCKDLYEACTKAIHAGVDMDMEGHAYERHMAQALAKGDVKIEEVDEAVRRVLRLKFRLGLFDNPYVKTAKSSQFYLPASLEAAKRAAVESAVLLKNDGTLPLGESVHSVAVVGPLADSGLDQVGTWCFDAEPDHCVTPLQAIKKLCGDNVKVLYEPGLTYSRDRGDDKIAHAVETARQADVILFFAGEEAVLSGEARCRADISLPGAQTQMLSELQKTGKPVVTIVMAGRPLTIGEETKNSNALLYAFHGGTMAGAALADLLWGKAVPSGKLPVSFPKMVGQVPVYYAHPNTGRPAANITHINDIPVGTKQTSLGFTSYYLDAGDGPLFPFGYGLSYTTFRYGTPTLSAGSLSMGDSLTVTCEVSNTGNRDGQEVIQLYVKDNAASIVRPVKELKGFQKLLIARGATQKVTFTLKADQLAFTHADMKRYAEPGDFTLWVGGDSMSGTPVTFTLK